MVKKIAGFTASVFLLLISCADNPFTFYHPDKIVPNTGNFESVTYRISSGWINFESVCTIDRSKKITLIEDCKYPEERHISLTGTLSDIQYDSLLKSINALDIMNLPADYRCKTDCPSDLPTENLTFSMDGYGRVISFDQVSILPLELQNILSMMENWGTALRDNK